MKLNNKTFKLALTAIMIALAVALSFVKVFQLPLGGAITLFSMLPICMISIMYGPVYAIAPAVIYGIIQYALDGFALSWGLTTGIWIGCTFFDYIFAFGILSVAGVFRKKKVPGIIGGVSLALVLRFISHFLSGFILWTNVEQWDIFGKAFENRPVLYSLVYNGSYMLPELILTLIGAVILIQVGPIKKLLISEDK